MSMSVNAPELTGIDIVGLTFIWVHLKDIGKKA